MKGVFLQESDSYVALGLTFQRWRTYKRQTKMKMTERGKKLYFIPYDDMTAIAKDMYASSVIEDTVQHPPDETEKHLEDIDDMEHINIHSNNKSHLDDILDDSIENKLAEARLENIKQRTITLKEKTLGHKRELFAEWTSEFFEAFEDSFGIFRNSLINLHLSEEQTKVLQDEIEKALTKMNTKLKRMIKNAKLTENEADVEELMKDE